MEKVKIQWFNNLKGYGEALKENGNPVYIHYTAFSRDKKTFLKEDQEIFCDIKQKEDGSLIATKATCI